MGTRGLFDLSVAFVPVVIKLGEPNDILSPGGITMHEAGTGTEFYSHIVRKAFIPADAGRPSSF